MKSRSRFAALVPAFIVGLALTLTAVDAAEAARRGGSFGSRGMRTYQAPRSTATAPQAAQPVQRSMTSPTQAAQAPRPGAAATAQPQRRGGFLGGLGGGLLGGLLLGGLFGMMMGNGFGGAAGMLALLVQAGLIALVLMLVFKFLRRRASPAPAPAYAGGVTPLHRDTHDAQALRPSYAPGGGAPRSASHDEIGIKDADFDAFDRLLGEIQTAYGREDYAALRDRTTPEVMGFLSEELGRNASEGRRNEISDVKLLQGDLSEAWREGEAEYATVAMRYRSLDVVRDRANGQVIEGDPDQPVEVTEIWTFRRDGGPWGGGWKLSAIQEV